MVEVQAMKGAANRIDPESCIDVRGGGVKCSQSLRRAMTLGGAAGFLVFSALFLSLTVYPPLEEGVVGRMIWEFPTPLLFLKGIGTLLFGSSSDERGMLFVLMAVCVEVVLVGAVIGGAVLLIRNRMQRH